MIDFRACCGKPQARASRSRRASGSPCTTATTAGPRIVFGLGEHLAGYDICRGRRIGDDEQFTWPGRRVDAHHTGDLQLGFGHVGVSGPDDPVHTGHGSGAAGERATAPAPPSAKTRSAPASSAAARTTGDGMPSGPGGEATTTSSDPGDTGGHGAHQHAAWICGASSRRVHANARQRIGTPADDDAGFGGRFDCGRAERRGEPSRCSAAERSMAFGGAAGRCVECRLPRCPWYLDVVEPDVIELGSEFAQRLVAASTHVGNDGGGGLPHREIHGSRAVQQTASRRPHRARTAIRSSGVRERR